MYESIARIVWYARGEIIRVPVDLKNSHLATSVIGYYTGRSAIVLSHVYALTEIGYGISLK